MSVVNDTNKDHVLSYEGLEDLISKMCETFLAKAMYEKHNHTIKEDGDHTHAFEGNVSNDINVSINSDMFVPGYSPGVLKLDGLRISQYESGTLSISKNNTNTVTGTVSNSLANCTIKPAGAHSHSGGTTAITTTTPTE